MTHRTPRRRAALSALSFATLALLGACGGGGGSTDDGGGTTALAITDANADDVARGGVASVEVGAMVGALGTGMGGASADQGGVVVQQVRRARVLSHRVLGALARVQPADVVACDNGGTLELTLTDSNGNGQLDVVGEAVTATASNCASSDGSVINGTFSITLTSFTSSQSFGFEFRFIGLRAVDAGSTSSIDGTLIATLSGGSTLSLSADNLSASVTRSGVTRGFTLSGFSVQATDRGDAVVETVAGHVAYRGLGGKAVTVSTPVPVVLRYADDHASAGTMRFAGDAGSVLQVEVIDATQLRLSVDANGDGSYETVRVRTWAELEG